MLIEGYSLLGAVYMTITTMSTVGFGEMDPLSKDNKYIVNPDLDVKISYHNQLSVPGKKDQIQKLRVL